MLTLYRTARYEGLLGGASPFVYKLETWLRLAGIEYEDKELSVLELLSTAPRGLIPYVDLGDERLDDSSIIIDRLKVLHGDPLNDGRLTKDQCAVGELVKSLCEHELFYLMAHGRWADGDYKTHGDFLFEFLPEDQRPAAIEMHCNTIKELLHTWRFGRYDAEFVRNTLTNRLATLSNVLGEGPWLLGDAPSTYDAGLYGAVASFVHYPLPDPHAEISRKFDNLVSYCDRIRSDYFDWSPS